MCVFRFWLTYLLTDRHRSAWVVYVVSMTEYNQEVPVTEGTNILQSWLH